MEIHLFASVSDLLKKEVTVFVSADRSVEIFYYFFVLKFPMLIVPAPVFIEPEDSFIFWNDDMGWFLNHAGIHLPLPGTVVSDRSCFGHFIIYRYLDNSFLSQIMKVILTIQSDQKAGRND